MTNDRFAKARVLCPIYEPVFLFICLSAFRVQQWSRRQVSYQRPVFGLNHFVIEVGKTCGEATPRFLRRNTFSPGTVHIRLVLTLQSDPNGHGKRKVCVRYNIYRVL